MVALSAKELMNFPIIAPSKATHSERGLDSLAR